MVIQIYAGGYPPQMGVCDSNGLLPLHHAACVSPVEVVRFLADSHPSGLTHRDNSGWLPMHHAAGYGSVDVVQYFAQRYEPALQAKTNDGWLPLHVAAQFAPLMVVQCLASKYDAALDVTTNHGHLPLHCAVNHAPVEVVQFLVEQRPQSLLVEDSDGDTPLHCAAEGAALPVVRCLVEGDGEKATLFERNLNGRVPLHIAAERSPLEVVKFLVEQDDRGDTLKSKDNQGLLPMHLAAEFAPYPVVKFLAVECPGALTVKSATGLRPVDLARQREDNKGIATWLEGATRQQEEQEEGSGGNSSRGASDSRKTIDDKERDIDVLGGSGSGKVDSGNVSDSDRSSVRVSYTSDNSDDEERDIAVRVVDSGVRGRDPPTSSATDPVPVPVTDPHHRDRDRVRRVMEHSSLEPVAVSCAYVQSVLTGSFLGEGFFGTVFKGEDPILGCEFAIKSINTEILRGGSKQDLEDAMKTFKTEQEVRASHKVASIVSVTRISNLNCRIFRRCLASVTRTLPRCLRTPTLPRKAPPAATISCTSSQRKDRWKLSSKTTWVGAALARFKGACRWRSTC